LRWASGPFASAEAACAVVGGSRCRVRGAFLEAETGWWVLLPDGGRWRAAHVPLEGARPHHLEARPPLYTVRLTQHAYTAGGLDVDGEWLWPCVAGACTASPLPLTVRDRSRDTDVDIAADPAALHIDAERSGAPLVVDVVFKSTRVAGSSARAGDWRIRIEALRGRHVLPRP
jgi:hypothetical protein